MYNGTRKPKIATLNALNGVSDALKDHRMAVTAAFTRYRKEMAEIGEKYAKDYAESQRAKARQAASISIEAADMMLGHEIRNNVATLRDSLREIVAAPVPSDFANSMKLYRDFGLKMSKAELEGFAASIYENYPATRILAAVAADSGFKVTMPAVQQMEQDIKRIERAGFHPSVYCPEGFTEEAREIYGRIPQFREDGSVYSWDKNVEWVALHLRTTEKTNLEKDVSGEMLKRWERVCPVIEQVDEKEYDTAEEAAEVQAELERKAVDAHVDALEIKPDNSAAVKADAARQAETERRSKDILERNK